jgi:hypothetical protein
MCRLAIEPDTCVRRGEDTFVRRGASALLIAKFLPGLNSIGQPLAGALGMPRQRFVIFDVLGAVLWVGLYVGLGYALHDQLAEAVVLADRLGASQVPVKDSALGGPAVETARVITGRVWHEVQGAGRLSYERKDARI